jgi:hypothetical protein
VQGRRGQSVTVKANACRSHTFDSALLQQHYQHCQLCTQTAATLLHTAAGVPDMQLLLPTVKAVQQTQKGAWHKFLRPWPTLPVPRYHQANTTNHHQHRCVDANTPSPALIKTTWRAPVLECQPPSCTAMCAVATKLLHGM